MKQHFSVPETVLNRYQIEYNEEGLEAAGYDDIQQLIGEYPNPWAAMANSPIIVSIDRVETLEYLSTNNDSLNYEK